MYVGTREKREADDLEADKEGDLFTIVSKETVVLHWWEND